MIPGHERREPGYDSEPAMPINPEPMIKPS
jgi:hypothetical protein